MVSGAEEWAPWLTSDLRQCFIVHYSFFFFFFLNVDYSLHSPSLFVLPFPYWFHHWAILASAYCIPGIILGTRNAVACSLETCHLVRKVNDKQPKTNENIHYGLAQTAHSETRAEWYWGVREGHSPGREAEIWMIRESQPYLPSCAFFPLPFPVAYRFIPAWCIHSLCLPIVEANGPLYSSLSPRIYQTAEGLTFLIYLYFLTSCWEVTNYYVFLETLLSFHCPLLLPLHTIHHICCTCFWYRSCNVCFPSLSKMPALPLQ